MENPVSSVTSAAKSAISVKNILAMAFGFLVVAVIADLAGITPWLISPVTTFKAWNAKRTA